MKQKELVEALTILGCRELEIQVYLNLLENRHLKILDLAKIQKTYRSKIYEAINLLEEKALLKYKKGSEKFSLASPSTISLLMYQEKRSLETKIKNLNQVLPNLNALFYNLNPNLFLKTVSGKNEIQKLFHELIYTDLGDSYIFGETEDTQSLLSKRLLEEMQYVRVKNKLITKILTYSNNPYLLGYKNNDFIIAKLLPQKYQWSSTIFLFSQNVVLLNTLENKAYLLPDNYVRQFLKNLFELIWEFVK